MTAGSGLTFDKTANTSPNFLMWSRFSDRSNTKDAYLAGTRELAVNERLQRAYYDPYCMRTNAALLASTAVSTAPRHMRSDVDRIVFGHEMDASEAAEASDGRGGSWDKGRIEGAVPEGNALLDRLMRPGESGGLRPNTSWAGQAASYIEVRPLNVSCRREDVWQRRVGAARPTSVQPRPPKAADAMIAVRGSRHFAEEMDRLQRGRMQCHLQRPRPLASRPW